MVDDLLARALPLPHGLEAAVPVEQLEDGHQLLELEHRLLQIRLQHVAEGGDAGGARVGLASDDLCGSVQFQVFVFGLNPFDNCVGKGWLGAISYNLYTHCKLQSNGRSSQNASPRLREFAEPDEAE